MSIPPVLLGDDFLPFWRQVSRYLDAKGLDARTRLKPQPPLPPSVRQHLGSVTGAPVGEGRRVDLAAVDHWLTARGLTVLDLLAAAGCPPAGRYEARSAHAEDVRRRDEALDAEAARLLGTGSWVEAWCCDVRRDLADADAARAAVKEVERALRLADDDHDRSRGEVAAQLGNAHQLDAGAPSRRRLGKALAHRTGAPTRWDEPELWKQVGLPDDQISVPLLTWALPLLGDGLAAVVRGATRSGAVMPLTVLSLRDLEVAVPPNTVVLSVENPRLLEAAAQRRLDVPMICTWGNLRRGVRLLVPALVEAAATVRHHGDFDPAGIAITQRMTDLGAVAWRMAARDYRGAVTAAAEDGIDLRPIEGPVPPTPWDPELQHVMTEHGRAVDEERVMDELLAAAVREGRNRAL